jgi:hypothetical protein
MITTLLTAALLAHPTTNIPAHAAATTYLDASFATTGLPQQNTTAGWPVPGVAAPTHTWWGSDPTGSGGATDLSCTLTGSTTTVNTPLCYGGDWSDLSASTCMKAQYFDGTSTTRYSCGNHGDIGTGSLTVCTIERHGTSSGAYVSKRTATPNGWYVYGTYAALKLPLTNANTYAGHDFSNSWVTACFAVDRANDHIYGVTTGNNNTVSAGTLSTTDYGTAAELTIGNDPTGINNPFTGDIAAVLIWENTALTTAQMRAVVNYSMGVDGLGSSTLVAQFASNASSCCWVSGQIHCFGQDVPPIGCDIPPGQTGSGTITDGGVLSLERTDNILKGSRLQNANWTEVGTSVVTNCTQTTTPLADGRPTCLLTDDDVGSVENITQVIAGPLGVAAGSILQFVAIARSSTASVLDLQIVESGVCTGSTKDFASATLDANWKMYSWPYTVGESNCTSYAFSVSPTDFAGAAGTGSAQTLLMLIRDGSLGTKAYAPFGYVETASGAANGLGGSLYYPVTGAAFLDGSGHISDNTKVQVSWLPFLAVQPIAGYLYNFSDNTVNQRSGARVDTSNRGLFVTTPGGTDITTSAMALTPGASLQVTSVVNYTNDSYSLQFSGVGGKSTTARASPTGVTYLSIGFLMPGQTTDQINGILRGVKVQK